MLVVGRYYLGGHDRFKTVVAIVCPKCKKEFLTESDYMRHSQIHQEWGIGDTAPCGSRSMNASFGRNQICPQTAGRVGGRVMPPSICEW